MRWLLTQASSEPQILDVLRRSFLPRSVAGFVAGHKGSGLHCQICLSLIHFSSWPHRLPKRVPNSKPQLQKTNASVTANTVLENDKA